MEGNLGPKRLNGIASEPDAIHGAGLQYEVKVSVIDRDWHILCIVIENVLESL
jgi:hypothetical protein